MTRRTGRDKPPAHPARVYGVNHTGRVRHIYRPTVDGVDAEMSYCGRWLEPTTDRTWRVCGMCERNATAIEARVTRPARQPREDGKS